jgi:hypothetical protein
MSACGVMATGVVATLFGATGSVVALPAVVVRLRLPLAGAVKLAAQVMMPLSGNGFGAGFGVQVCAVPGGSPPITQLGAAAGLGPALVQVPVTVTVCPAFTVAGAVMAACMSACGVTLAEACAALLAVFGSCVLLPATPVIVMPPVAGVVKLTAQVMAEPTGSGFGAGFGVQLTVAPGGVLVTVQLGLAAGLGPALVQVTVPLTVLPAGGLVGMPEMVATRSACGVMARLRLTLLLPGTGSGVLLPAVVAMVSVPEAGAVKVDVQVIDWPTGSGFGAGLGAQVCVAPTGRPASAQVGAAAALGPLLVQVPLTVTG